MRIAYFKVYHPVYFYAAQLSVRWKDADVTEIIKPAAKIKQRIYELDDIINKKTKKNETTANEKKMQNYLRVVHEAKERGIEFGNVRIYGSHARRWIVEEGVIIPPFVSVPALGDTAADKLHQAAQESIFRGAEDLRVRGGLTKTVMETLRSLHCLHLIEAKQNTLY